MRRHSAEAMAALVEAHGALERMLERFELIDEGELVTVEEVEAVVAQHDRAAARLGEWRV